MQHAVQKEDSQKHYSDALPARGLREVVMHILLGRNGDTEARGGQEMPIFQRGEHLGVYDGTEA